MDASSGKAAIRVKQVDDSSGSLNETLTETTLGISRVEALFVRTEVAADRLQNAQDRLANAQINHQTAVENLSTTIAKYGSASTEAAKAQDALEKSTNALQVAQNGVTISTLRQESTYLLMIPTIIDFARDMKDWVTTQHLAADAAAFLRDVEESDVVVKAQAIVASGAHVVAENVETAAVWFLNAGLETQIILLSALTLGAFAAAAAFGAFAGVGTVNAATSNVPDQGVYTKASPLKFLTGPLAGQTVPESGPSIRVGDVSGPLSTADVKVDIQAQISKDADAVEVGRLIGRQIAEEIRRR